MTSVQKAILDTIKQSKQHLSADDVFLAVKKQFPSVALGTIYRNLNHFADDMLIRRVSRPDGADYYEGNISPHDHSVCIRCHEMVDLKIPDLKDFIKKQLKCEIISFDLTVNYICPDCSNEIDICHD